MCFDKDDVDVVGECFGEIIDFMIEVGDGIYVFGKEYGVCVE